MNETLDMNPKKERKKRRTEAEIQKEGFNEGVRETLENIQTYVHLLFQNQIRREFGNIPVPPPIPLEGLADAP